MAWSEPKGKATLNAAACFSEVQVNGMYSIYPVPQYDTMRHNAAISKSAVDTE
jgi:hypothetical protein